MAKQKSRTFVKKSLILEEEVNNGFFSKIKFTDSYTSLILGVIVVLIIGILFFAFVRGNKNLQTSSTQDESSISENTSSTYTIKPGDDLWSISENVYKDGYKWVEIAKANKIEDPSLIHVGNKLEIIPLDQNDQIVTSETSPESSDNAIENNSITGNSYKIKSGDNLWDIAVRAYGDGYKWVEIAKANTLENPDLIHSDNMLKLPR